MPIPVAIHKLVVRLHLDHLVMWANSGTRQSAREVGGNVHQAGHDLIQTQIVHQGLTRAEVQGMIEARITELKAESALPMHVEPARLPEPLAVEVAVDGFGIIRAFDLEGSRVHLDFYVANDSQESVSVTGVMLTVNDCLLRIKQFFTRDGELRVPDPGCALREVGPGSFDRLSIEFENAGASIVYSEGIRGQLDIQLSDGRSVVGSFSTGPLALKAIFAEIDEWCREHNSAMAFDVPIESARR
jgi:hypothetical protein